MNPERISGLWKDGYTLDVHTISSVPAGHDEYGHQQFDTTRSELGELLYKLKYHTERTAAAPLAKAAADFVKKWGIEIDVVVSVPPTKARSFQPAVAVAEKLASLLGVPLDTGTVKRTKKAQELKGVMDPDKRAELLKDAFRIDGSALNGKNILLFDDLYRSGATMNAVAGLLRQSGGTANIFALALTRTRSIA